MLNPTNNKKKGAESNYILNQITTSNPTLILS